MRAASFIKVAAVYVAVALAACGNKTTYEDVRKDHAAALTAMDTAFAAMAKVVASTKPVVDAECSRPALARIDSGSAVPAGAAAVDLLDVTQVAKPGSVDYQHRRRLFVNASPLASLMEAMHGYHQSSDSVSEPALRTWTKASRRCQPRGCVSRSTAPPARERATP